MRNVAAQLAELAVFGPLDSYVTDYTKKIAAVSKDDVRLARRRKYLDPNHLTIVVVGDRQHAGRAARQAGAGREPRYSSTAIRCPGGPATLPGP